MKIGGIKMYVKLNKEQVKEIKILIKTTNIKQQDIAQLYNVSRTLISLIKNNKIYADIN